MKNFLGGIKELEELVEYQNKIIEKLQKKL